MTCIEHISRGVRVRRRASERAGSDISNSSRGNSKTTAAPIVNYTYQRKVVTNGFWLCMALEKPYWIFHIRFFSASSSSSLLLLSSLYFCDMCVCFYFMLIINIAICEQANVLFGSRLLAHSLAINHRCLFAR